MSRHVRLYFAGMKKLRPHSLTLLYLRSLKKIILFSRKFLTGKTKYPVKRVFFYDRIVLYYILKGV